ncbi:RNA dependent RNA polymerase-domain-containing protein, partial [Chaetomium sp. MPI-SDFR-AT-0129]
AGSTAPKTPSKSGAGTEDIEDVIKTLNKSYGLGIDLMNIGHTPQHRRALGLKDEDIARWNNIRAGVKYLLNQDEIQLDLALMAFNRQSKEASQHWVPKPRGESDTVPSTFRPPKAETGEQQRQLQEILIRVFDRARKEVITASNSRRTKTPGTTSAAKAKSSAKVRAEAESGSGSGSDQAGGVAKRLFDRVDNHEVKRQKGVVSLGLGESRPAPGQFASTANFRTHQLDNVPTRQRPTLPAAPRAPPQQPQQPTRHTVVDHNHGRGVIATTDGRDESGTDSAAAGREKMPRGELTIGQFSAKGAVVRPPNMAGVQPSRLAKPAGQPAFSVPASLQDRLESVFPVFPGWLHPAPLAIAWEVTRICLHCGVDLEDPSLRYQREWAKSDLVGIWRSLQELDVFRGKTFPERPSPEAFAAALSGNFECRGNTVAMTASLDFNPASSGPLLLLDMKPLRLDEGCRLTRRFGADRFLEIVMPSPTASAVPDAIKKMDGADEQIFQWISGRRHNLVGREWQVFFSKDAGYRKPAKDVRLGPDSKSTYKERVHLFAENGPKFRRVTIRSRAEIPVDAPQQWSQMRAGHVLDWLLQLEQNGQQPYLKLFSRIQLGLSKTFPALTLEIGQVIHHSEDILSPIGKVMNDGIGRMSRTVARKIRDAMGLIDIPSAIQGRLGSAKGMWLLDVADMGNEDWIETYPSQRKWICDDSEAAHRTLEVRSIALELGPARLNLQILPVLEDRALDPILMREAIGGRLTGDLQRQFEVQKTVMNHPAQLRQWVNESSNTRGDRVKHGRVPFLAGLPDNKAEVQSLLLNSGFDPRAQKYLQELTWDLQKQKCDTLRSKLNVRIGRSTYAYMVVDFWGVLEENEVHLGFSSRFRDDTGSSDFSDTMVANCDVLVARSPAHFISDVQKVRAVFKPELHALKDVIVFSAKGNVPLADKLSGGDYDGDMAWVCWDPAVVDNFMNADVPEEPDLSEYLGKNKETFQDLVDAQPTKVRADNRYQAHCDAALDMIKRSIPFQMTPNFLGICTNFKERACYWANNVSDSRAVLLSSLVGKLVDQSKQGILFNGDDWDRLRRDHFAGRVPRDEPAYKGNQWTVRGQKPRHIIDYLKFTVAKPAIDHELDTFHKALSPADEALRAHHWDPQLAVYHDAFKAAVEKSPSLKELLAALTNAIAAVEKEWRRLVSNRENHMPYPDKVKLVHARWQAIDLASLATTTPTIAAALDAKLTMLLGQGFLDEHGGCAASATGFWSLLKASTAFKAYYRSNPRFVWQMAGAQLAFMKAQFCAGGNPPPVDSRTGAGNAAGTGTADAMALLVTPGMYAGLVPDGKFTKQYMARLEGAEDGEDTGEDSGAQERAGQWDRGEDFE